VYASAGIVVWGKKIVGGRETVFFDSHDVSKPDSRSDLNVAGAHLQEGGAVLDPVVTAELVQRLRSALGLSLFGVDGGLF